MIRKRLYNALPPPTYRSEFLAGWQNVNNIIDAIKYQHKHNLADAKKIAHYFKGRNEKESAKKVFDFLKNEIQYRVEPAEKQTTKSLPRFLADGQGDCKHFALFSCTILNSLGYKCRYRFAGYNGKGISHVYAYLPNSDIVLDAVLPYFNTEKTPSTKKDIDMSLYRLSGIDDQDEVGGLNFSKVKDAVQKASAKASNVVQKAVKDVPSIAKKVVQGTKTMTLAVPRTAFLGLVRINAFGLATDLQKLHKAKGMPGLQFWFDLGGDRSALIDVINNGAKQKRIMGVQEENASYNDIFRGYDGGVNTAIGEPVTLATAVATATPILIKVKDVLAKSGIKVDELASAVTKGKDTFQSLTGKKVEDVIFKKDAGSTSTRATITASDLSATSNEDAKKIATSSIALATGQPVSTIKEMVEETATSSMDTLPSPVPASYNPNIPTFVNPSTPIVQQSFDKWYEKPSGMLAIAGGLFLLYTISKK